MAKPSFRRGHRCKSQLKVRLTKLYANLNLNISRERSKPGQIPVIVLRFLCLISTLLFRLPKFGSVAVPGTYFAGNICSTMRLAIRDSSPILLLLAELVDGIYLMAFCVQLPLSVTLKLHCSTHRGVNTRIHLQSTFLSVFILFITLFLLFHI